MFRKISFYSNIFVKPTLQDIHQLTRQILLRLVYEQRSWVTEFGHMLNTSAFQVSVELILMVVLFKYLHKLKQKQFSYLHFCDAFLKPGVGEFWGGCGFFCFPEAKSIFWFPELWLIYRKVTKRLHFVADLAFQKFFS